MDVSSKKDGYGFLIDWLIKLGDIILLNLFFFVLYTHFQKSIGNCFISDKSELGELFLLVNLSYFITASIITINLSNNIIFFDKVIQRSFNFISLYIIILIVGLTIFNIIDFSWLSWFLIYLSLTIIYCVWHTLLRILLKIYRRKGYNYKRVVIVGEGLNGISVFYELKSSVYGYKVLGFFDDNMSLKNNLPCDYLGTISDIEDYCIKNNVDEIYCTLPGNQETKILQLFNFAEKNMIRFYLVPEFYKYIKKRLVLKFLHATPIIGIREEPLQSLHNRIIKRAFDIAFSFTVIITVFPVLYLIFGTIIKLSSPGPILFKQKRTGLQGKVFDCYKFRSMMVNDQANSIATTKHDPRVTKIGAFMRKTSIDEIPQFLNVLKGDMSVVGPRPHMIQQTELYYNLIDKFMIRHLVKPGITGWAQVSGYRGETATINKMEGRFKRDMWYIENWTFMLDIKIIFVTILNMFRGDEEAY